LVNLSSKSLYSCGFAGAAKYRGLSADRGVNAAIAVNVCGRMVIRLWEKSPSTNYLHTQNRFWAKKFTA